jgi:hypothetical protein
MLREGFGDAQPSHEVEVDGFWMDAAEMTNAQFRKFVEATGYVTVAERKPKAEDFPGVPDEALVPGSVKVSGQGREYQPEVDFLVDVDWGRVGRSPNSAIPEGATFLRVTDDAGRTTILARSDLKGANPLAGVGQRRAAVAPKPTGGRLWCRSRLADAGDGPMAVAQEPTGGCRPTGGWLWRRSQLAGVCGPEANMRASVAQKPTG